MPRQQAPMAMSCVYAAVAVLLSVQAALAQQDPSVAEPPNIVFIIIDDMGYADLGCYGSEHIQTPRVDQMAAEGMRFTDAYSGCSVCAPARSTLMTGLHTGHTPVRGNTGGIPLRDEDVTLAELLKEAGYATGGFGKWGLGDLDTPGVPERQGFDKFFGYYHQVHAHYFFPDYLIDTGRKVPLPGNEGVYDSGERRAVIPVTDPETGRKRVFSQYPIFEQMKSFIHEHKDESFFCYAPWTPPHQRYEILETEPAWQLYKDKDWPMEARIVATFDTMIDRQVGEVLDLLAELGLDEKTVVFFCSDNGASQRFDGIHNSSGPLRGRKRDMYEGGLRVPFIARWPGRIPAGTESDFPCYFPDILPTCCELVGIPVPENLDGISLVNVLTENPGKTAEERPNALYWEYPNYNWNRGVVTSVHQAYREGHWKLVRLGLEEPVELYDLRSDIGEEHNLTGERPDLAESLTKKMNAQHDEAPPQVEPKKPEGQRYR